MFIVSKYSTSQFPKTFSWWTRWTEVSKKDNNYTDLGRLMYERKTIENSVHGNKVLLVDILEGVSTPCTASEASQGGELNVAFLQCKQQKGLPKKNKTSAMNVQNSVVFLHSLKLHTLFFFARSFNVFSRNFELSKKVQTQPSGAENFRMVD